MKGLPGASEKDLTSSISQPQELLQSNKMKRSSNDPRWFEKKKPRSSLFKGREALITLQTDTQVDKDEEWIGV